MFGASDTLAERLALLAGIGELPRTLRDAGASRDDLRALARDAEEQWTGKFNPRPLDAAGALEIYECAF
jgi:alcohol dehydrogenase